MKILLMRISVYIYCLRYKIAYWILWVAKERGINARLIEIEIEKENKNMLFDTYSQCKQIEMFFQNNYGNIH